MYKIYADGTLIYDSTVEDYKIGAGLVSLETNKSGTFTFSLYPEHFYYDKFVKLKTVVTVTKSEKIIFRGRVLDDTVDYWNRKVLTCEGELGFLQDSVIRPFNFSGTPEDLFFKFVNDHNAQVDEFKRFQLGEVTVLDPNDYIARSNSAYETTLSNMNSRLIEDSLGGYFHVTHGTDGTDPLPTLNYLSDFTRISSQNIEFGSNLRDYLKTSTGQEIATAIIPLGAEVDDGDVETGNARLTIKSVNGGVDYVYDEAAVAAYGWVFRVVEWDDVTEPENLKIKAFKYLEESVRESVTLELNAIDLHLLDRSIESFQLGDYVRVISPPHNFAETLLCHRQTFDLLKPQNDTITLGKVYTSFAASSARAAALTSTVSAVKKEVIHLNKKTNEYKIAEQQLTSLMAQSFGVFKTASVLEDGSTVYYLHDKPVLEDSQNIWKMTGDAFAVSSDGGKTWSAGLDASGNAIMNILSVIGIEASWINADNLTAISANLGGWLVDNEKIYKEVTDVNDSTVRYRVYIKPPTNEKAGTTEVISCQKSKNSGASFNTIFSLLSNGSIELYDETRSYSSQIDGSGFNILDGSDGTTRWYVGNLNYSGYYESGQKTGAYARLDLSHCDNYANQIAHCKLDPTGLNIWDRNMINLAYLNDTKNTANGWQLGCDSAYINKWIQCNGSIVGYGIRDYNAYSGTITLGGIAFNFQGGILAGAWYA